MNRVVAWCALVLAFAANTLYARDVGYAGFSYAGDYGTIQSRFPFTSQIIPPHGSVQTSQPSTAEQLLLAGARRLKPAGFNLVVDALTQLEGRDEAILVILEVTDETVSTEKFDDLTKLFIDIRAQALFFDFKSKTVLRSYPISAVYLGALPGEPTNAKKLETVRELIVGGEQPGLIGHFLERLAHASLPQSVSRFIRVANVTVADGAVSTLPEYFRSPGVSETWIADQFSEALLDEAGVSLLPYAKGYAIGNTIAAHLADGTAFNFQIPAADYSVSIELRALKRVPFGEVPAGRSYIYGAYVHLLVEEPLLQQHYFDVVLKNGETKIVPASQSTVDDWPAFQDAITGLFKKFAGTVAPAGNDEKWIKSSATVVNIAQQVDATRTVLNSCN
jgi:hypothetical protein